MHIDKSYFTLPEILERWQITEADLIYLAENDKLRLSVRVFGAPMEFGDYEEGADGEPCRVPWEQNYYSGLLDLHARDVFQLSGAVRFISRVFGRRGPTTRAPGAMRSPSSS
jgi:hypothetical protein